VISRDKQEDHDQGVLAAQGREFRALRGAAPHPRSEGAVIVTASAATAENFIGREWWWLAFGPLIGWFAIRWLLTRPG
jgi:hypothetical protein